MTDEELRTLVASLATATASLQASSESQARSIEAMRESISFNTETVASSLELAAASQRTAAAAMDLSANTSRNLDRLENDIADLKQIVGIVIKDNQADQARITGLEGQG